MARLTITLRRSLAGRPRRQRAVARALGLRRIDDAVTRADRPAIRGMVAKVRHLVEVRPGPPAGGGAR
jgi:large subunit ribosomal protein L30